VTSALIQAMSTIVLNVGFFASDLDFVILMRLTGLFWNGVLGIAFLGERISKAGILAIGVIVVGMVLTVGDFQWSTTTMTSNVQIGIQSISIFLMSVGSLVTKKTMQIIDQTETTFSVFDYLAWVAGISFPAIFAVSLVKEPVIWTDLGAIVTTEVIWWTLLGAGIHVGLNIVLAQMHRFASLMSIGVAGQVKLLGSLMVSHFVYGQTDWGISRTVGVVLLAVGGVMYSYTRLTNGTERPREVEASVRLIPLDTEFSVASD
jgi:drug/metabolite transporter (DMT)-like permease